MIYPAAEPCIKGTQLETLKLQDTPRRSKTFQEVRHFCHFCQCQAREAAGSQAPVLTASLCRLRGSASAFLLLLARILMCFSTWFPSQFCIFRIVINRPLFSGGFRRNQIMRKRECIILGNNLAELDIRVEMNDALVEGRDSDYDEYFWTGMLAWVCMQSKWPHEHVPKLGGFKKRSKTTPQSPAVAIRSPKLRNLIRLVAQVDTWPNLSKRRWGRKCCWWNGGVNPLQRKSFGCFFLV